jgi:hypothetical protein
MGIARLALAGLACVALLALIGLGVRALIDSLDTGGAAAPTPSATGSPTQVPTVYIECRREVCATVFVRVPGGDVLLDRELMRGERASFADEALDVVLSDGSAVVVRVNGVPRSPGRPGEREAFTARRTR